MKKIKIILAAVLMFCILICAVSCNNDKNVGTEMDSSKLYNEAKTKTEEQESYRIEKKVERTFIGESGSFCDSAHTTLTHALHDDGTHRYSKSISSVLKSELSGRVESSSMLYCIDNMMYEKNAKGEKFSYIVKEGDIAQQFENIIPTFPAEALANSSVYKGDVTQVVAGTEAATLYSQLYLYLGGLTEYYSPIEGSDVFEFTYSNIKISYDIGANGCLDRIEMTFDAFFDHSRGRSEIETLVSYEFENDAKADITVELPEDANEYIWYVEGEDAEDVNFENEVEALHDELGNPVADYAALYEGLCEKYGKERVDSFLVKTQPEME